MRIRGIVPPNALIFPIPEPSLNEYAHPGQNGGLVAAKRQGYLGIGGKTALRIANRLMCGDVTILGISGGFAPRNS